MRAVRLRSPSGLPSIAIRNWRSISNWPGALRAFCRHSAKRPILAPTNPPTHHPIIAPSMTAPTYATAGVLAPAETPYPKMTSEPTIAPTKIPVIAAFAVRGLSDVVPRQSLDGWIVALDKPRPCDECRGTGQIAQSRAGLISQTKIQQRTHEIPHAISVSISREPADACLTAAAHATDGPGPGCRTVTAGLASLRRDARHSRS